MANKVKFGLRNVHYAVVTETADVSTGAITSSYGTVKAWPGAVNMTLDPAGEDTPFYADDIVYATISSNTGYTGTLESALIPEDVYTAAFGQTKNSNGIVVEKSNDTKKYIAIMTEFQGDTAARRYCFYRCMLTRPSVAGATKEASATPQTETVNITITPRPDDEVVRVYCDQGADAYSTFFSAVPSPAAPSQTPAG